MKRIRLFETLLYASILLVVLYIPFFTGAFEIEGWCGVINKWLMIIPYLIVMLIHNFILVPKLLFTGKYLYYLKTCLLAVVAIVFISYCLVSLHLSFGGRLESVSLWSSGQFRFFITGQTIFAVLMLGFNAGVKSFVRWSEEREQQSERERQYLQTELAILKHQISPHFFMNTLNNIHSLIDIDTEKARDAIVKLSRMMRYLLYEADVQKVSLKKEIEFIESYIELMRLRYDEEILTVETEFSAVTEDIFVPSFLFLSFIENAFTHGVSTQSKSLIRIWFTCENKRLNFGVKNNKSGIAPAIKEASGIGLENVRKRLDLIFKDDYVLEIRSADDIYETVLNIPL
jgi:sensor histidine kinase YesM